MPMWPGATCTHNICHVDCWTVRSAGRVLGACAQIKMPSIEPERGGQRSMREPTARVRRGRGGAHAYIHTTATRMSMQEDPLHTDRHNAGTKVYDACHLFTVLHYCSHGVHSTRALRDMRSGVDDPSGYLSLRQARPQPARLGVQ